MTLKLLIILNVFFFQYSEESNNLFVNRLLQIREFIEADTAACKFLFQGKDRIVLNNYDSLSYFHELSFTLVENFLYSNEDSITPKTRYKMYKEFINFEKIRKENYQPLKLSFTNKRSFDTVTCSITYDYWNSNIMIVEIRPYELIEYQRGLFYLFEFRNNIIFKYIRSEQQISFQIEK